MPPELVYFLLEQELLNISKTISWYPMLPQTITSNNPTITNGTKITIQQPKKAKKKPKRQTRNLTFRHNDDPPVPFDDCSCDADE